MDDPVRYEILVQGELDDCWQDWFVGLRLINLGDGQTLLTGPLPDQAALHGVLAKIRDLNMTLISVSLQDFPKE